MLFRIRRYLDDNAGGGSGGGGGTGGGTGAGTGGAGAGAGGGGGTGRLPSRVEADFQGMLLRTPGTNDAERAIAAARVLYDDNHQLRTRVRTLKGEVDGFKTRNPQGSIVLHGQDLADYNAWKALGKPAEIKTKLDEAEKTRNELAAATRKTTRAEAATLLGFNPAALDDRLTVANLDVEIREETQSDNTKKKVAFARKAGDAAATWEPLGTIATRDWASHLPALKQAGGAGGTGGDLIPFPNNGASGGGTSGSVVDSFIKRSAEAAQQRPNPLRPQGASTATK